MASTPSPPPKKLQETVFPSRKRRWQGTQLMNLLFRPLLGPLVRPLAALGLRADLLTLLGSAAYLAGAWQFCQGTREGLALGTLGFGLGLLAELLDGSLARLRGPTPLGWFLSQFQAELYLMLLLPSLGIGLYRARGDGEGLALLLLGVFGGCADLMVRHAIEVIARTHPEAEMRARADASPGRLERLFLAQFLPDHPVFTGFDRGLRILRENLYYSSGIQPLVLLAAVLLGRPEVFVLLYGCLNLAALLLSFLARVLLLLRGGGRIL